MNPGRSRREKLLERIQDLTIRGNLLWCIRKYSGLGVDKERRIGGGNKRDELINLVMDTD
jgi:hypothetical protein